MNPKKDTFFDGVLTSLYSLRKDAAKESPEERARRISQMSEMIWKALVVNYHPEPAVAEFLDECFDGCLQGPAELFDWYKQFDWTRLSSNAEQIRKALLRAWSRAMAELVSHYQVDDESKAKALILDAVEHFIWSQVGEICDLMRVCGRCFDEPVTDDLLAELHKLDRPENLTRPIKGTYNELIRALVTGKAQKDEGIEQVYEAYRLVRDGKMTPLDDPEEAIMLQRGLVALQNDRSKAAKNKRNRLMMLLIPAMGFKEALKWCNANLPKHQLRMFFVPECGF